MADQGLFTASNFALNILLARWLAPEDYGAFAVAYAVFALVGVVHNALLSEPMLIFGSGRHRARLSEYLGVLLYGHTGFGLLCGLLLLVAGLTVGFSGPQGLAMALLGLAGTAPFMLLQVLMRQACYVRLKPHLAAAGGALYMALMLSGASLLYVGGWLSASTAFVLMGFSGLVSGVFLATILRVSLPSLRRGALLRPVAAEHWVYGRWSVGTRAMAWVTGSSYFVLLPIWGGLEETAALRALMNLILPVLQAYAALSVLLLPTLVQARGEAGFGHAVRWAYLLFVSGSTLYWLLLGLLHRPLMDWLYDGRYTGYADLIWLLGLVPVVAGVAEVQSTVLRALDRIDLVFWSSVISTAAALTAGLGALYAFGVYGVPVWLTLSWIAAVLAMWWFLLTRAKGK